ncbi:hypothetical protein VPH35_030750 [Triticum aestivum]
MSTAPSGKGKPGAPRKTAAPKTKKALMPEQRARESAKRKDRRHAADARDEAIAAVPVVAQQEVTNARVAATTREMLYMLRLNPSQHGLVNATVAAASTGSSAFPRMVMPDSRCALACTPMPGFHVFPQASRLFKECSPEVSAVAPSTPAPAPIDLNATPVAGGSSSGGARKRTRGEVQGAICGPQVAWGGKQAVEEVGDDEKARPRGKTYSKKEDKRDAASISLIRTVEGMMTKKDSREEKRLQDKEEQMNAFMEIQRRRLEMDAEKQVKILEMEAEKQAKMLEIETANAKTKAKEVTLASMMTGWRS